jgi:hypothetical protein
MVDDGRQVSMNARSIVPATVLVVISIAACSGAPAASPSAIASPSSAPSEASTDAPASPSSTPTTLLPDGIWEASPTGAAYRLTFDGTRARIDLRGTECDADASPAGQTVRLQWHVAMGCGGYDTIRWSFEPDGLHLSLVDTDGDAASSRAVFETEPWTAVEGDATLSWSDAWATCGNPDAGACLNTLTAGTYSTEAFEPGLTYTMPDGWQNLSDIAGEVAFLAPGDSLDDPDAEGIVVFTSVRAENRKCSTLAEAESDEPGVAHTPEAMAAEFQARPGLTTSTPEPATIGGLSGLVMDISMAPDWTGMCFYWDEPAVQLIGGVPPSEFDHAIIPGLTMRLYLLARGSSTIAVEISDFSDGAHLDAYSAIVEQFKFGG